MLYGRALKFAPNEAKSDPTVVRAALALHPSSLQFASATLARDRAFVLGACAAAGEEALRWADAALRADEEVVLAAVRQSGRALRFASDALRADRGVVRAAVGQNPFALRHADGSLTADRGFMLELVRARGEETLQFASGKLKADKELVLAAVAQNPWALQHASPALLADPQVVAAAVAAEGDTLQCVLLVCSLASSPQPHHMLSLSLFLSLLSLRVDGLSQQNSPTVHHGTFPHADILRTRRARRSRRPPPP